LVFLVYHKNIYEQQEIPKFSVSQNYIVCAFKHKFIVLEQKISNNPIFSTESSTESTPLSSHNDNIDLNYYKPVATGGESERK